MSHPAVRRPPSRTPVALAVFLKTPVPGKVKTRLAEVLGVAPATAFYRCLLLDTLDLVARLGPGFAPRLFVSPPEDAATTVEGLLPPGQRASLPSSPQRGEDLGERLESAFDELLASGAGAAPGALCVGTDCPLLEPRLLRRAARELGRADVVLGPARDGGYWLVGLRRPRPALFRGIAWSTPDVLAQTIERARAEGLRVHLLPELGDADRRDDLAPLLEELRAAWHAVRAGRRGTFPHRTLRWLDHELAPRSPRSPRSRSRRGPAGA